MPENESTIIQAGQEGDDNSEISREEIARYFSERPYLDQKNLDALKQLPPREAFALLISARPDSFLAIDLLKEFPQSETIQLLLELRQNPQYARETKTIDWIFFQFAHNPAVSQEAINILKELGDPRAVLETDAGKIELATESALAEVVSLVPALAEHENWLAECFRQGAVFTLRAKDDELASVAVAHQLPGGSLYLDYIYTTDNKREKGRATDLISYLLKNHVVLQCVLSRVGMFSEKALTQLGFEHTGSGDRWVYLTG